MAFLLILYAIKNVKSKSENTRKIIKICVVNKWNKLLKQITARLKKIKHLIRFVKIHLNNVGQALYNEQVNVNMKDEKLIGNTSVFT